MLIILHLYELKLLFLVLHKSLISVYSLAKFTHKREGKFFMPPGSMPCLLWLFHVNQLYINLGISSDHGSFLQKQCNKFDPSSDVIYSWHHHALSNKKFFLNSLLWSTVQIYWFVFHLVSLAKFRHTKEVNIFLG